MSDPCHHEHVAGGDLHQRFGARPVAEWYAATVRAAETKDPSFPKFSHIPRLGSADLRSGIDEAFKLYDIARPHLDCCVGPGKRYLDFGCGVGRILRTFARDFAPEDMTGIDPTEEFIEICKADFGPRFNFHHIKTRPPSPLADRSVDVITSYSVFSHFSQIQATRWLDEFNRITRPGATLILTTYGRSHLDHISTTPVDELPPNKAAHLKDVTEAGGLGEFKRMFALGEMLYYARGGAGFGVHDYGQAYVGEEFVHRIWGRHFDVVEIVDDFERLEQMAVVLRKPH